MEDIESLVAATRLKTTLDYFDFDTDIDYITKTPKQIADSLLHDFFALHSSDYIIQEKTLRVLIKICDSHIPQTTKKFETPKFYQFFSSIDDSIERFCLILSKKPQNIKDVLIYTLLIQFFERLISSKNLKTIMTVLSFDSLATAFSLLTDTRFQRSTVVLQSLTHIFKMLLDYELFEELAYIIQLTFTSDFVFDVLSLTPPKYTQDIYLAVSQMLFDCVSIKANTIVFTPKVNETIQFAIDKLLTNHIHSQLRLGFDGFSKSLNAITKSNIRSLCSSFEFNKEERRTNERKSTKL
ncbi:hypothetical protein EIN_398160 [Entamoeba invadens IP1]|uniref:Uncharacterized protein n=1 Tax=Entamoeba invadens IP1 TaxID=370355 RepID=A0A0A1UDK0_ENTIV|nr:hypothetical protein EIN_398160 [Entamoeba invadens IP1]ELP91886.1 hypothetical protein EIN_398160 [Entamoeba invadens IP1]|eukprot:XP_004258657.1 hypothetical protein EIN_398160 [Entamoeba invadens IP1]